jgi:putative transposase
LIFATKYRHAVFAGRHLERLEAITRDMRTDLECELAKFNGETSHVHLLVNFPPKVALSRLVNSRKGCVPPPERQEFPDLRWPPSLSAYRWSARKIMKLS